MVKGLQKAIQSLWNGRMTVIERVPQRDNITKQTDFVEKIIYENQPCRLSYSNAESTTREIVAEKQQQIKLFCSPSLEIPAGSKIIVTQNRITNYYCRSGEPPVYSNHQEISLDIFERWA